MNILFATMPFDGHFNPLTGIAMHLRAAGHDVRWYAGPSYGSRLERLGIPHFPFKRAREINGDTIADHFPERARLRGMALIRFDGRHIFVGNTTYFFEDLRELDAAFPFDVLICDMGFFAMRLVKAKLGKRVYAVDIAPSGESDPDLPPNFVGMQPARTPLGRLAHRALGALMERVAMGDASADLNAMLAAQGLLPFRGPLLDVPYHSPDLVFLSGVPGFAYPRRNPNPKARFVGALLPYQASVAQPFPHPEKLSRDKPVILISQGTVDNKDPGKLIVPALEALKDTNALLIVATGHSKTTELRRAYPQDNVIIEDYVDFAHVLDHADLFICNGGYGSILLSLSHAVPVLSAGVREGKNDVNAHVDHFEVGIDLRTESPKPSDIRRAAERLLSEPRWKRNVARLRDEFSAYRPYEIIDAYLADTAAFRNEAHHPALQA